MQRTTVGAIGTSILVGVGALRIALGVHTLTQHAPPRHAPLTTTQRCVNCQLDGTVIPGVRPICVPSMAARPTAAAGVVTTSGLHPSRPCT